MPLVRMTKVMPIARMPTIATCRRMLSKLGTDRNRSDRSEAAMTKSTSAASTPTRRQILANEATLKDMAVVIKYGPFVVQPASAAACMMADSLACARLSVVATLPRRSTTTLSARRRISSSSDEIRITHMPDETSCSMMA